MTDEENKQTELLGETLDSGASAIKGIENFLSKILLEIIRHIYRLVFVKIPCWLWNIISYIFVRIYKNFSSIICFVIRSIKLAVILGILIALIVWPFFVAGMPGLLIWIIFVIIPGTYFGIFKWYLKCKKQKEENNSTASENTTTSDVSCEQEYDDIIVETETVAKDDMQNMGTKYFRSQSYWKNKQ